MRLGQFARKYDIRVQDLISYLEGDAEEAIHSNTKLSDAEESEILDFFGIEKDIQEEAPENPVTEGSSIEEQSAETLEPTKEIEAEWDAEDSGFTDQVSHERELPKTPEEDIALAEGEIETLSSDSKTEATLSDPPAKDDQTSDMVTPNEDEIIQTDKLLEMLESEETPAELEKIKLIKAPKRELSGLKVLGKVELPERKKKEEKEPTVHHNERRAKRPPLSEEEKERRRLKAKRKKEAYEARQEKRRKEQETQRLKELKAKHYKQKLQKPPSKKSKTSVVKPNEMKQMSGPEKAKPTPKTWLGKWWRWMNT